MIQVSLLLCIPGFYEMTCSHVDHRVNDIQSVVINALIGTMMSAKQNNKTVVKSEIL